MTSKEEVAKEAVRADFVVFREYSLLAKKVVQHHVRNSCVYRIKVVGDIDPPPIFLVAIGPNDDSCVFPANATCKYTRDFSKVIANDRIYLDDDRPTIERYVAAMLFFLDTGSFVLSSIDDLPKLPNYLQNAIERYRTNVTPLSFRIEEGIVHISFCSWSVKMVLRKWDLTVKLNGEILSCEAYDLARLKM